MVAITWKMKNAHRHQKDDFGGPLVGLDPTERDYAERYWRKMITDEQIDRFDNREEQARQCSEPSKQAREIYRKLGYKEAPFKKMKICRSQRPPEEKTLK